jgi:hypothetical protein
MSTWSKRVKAEITIAVAVNCFCRLLMQGASQRRDRFQTRNAIINKTGLRFGC